MSDKTDTEKMAQALRIIRQHLAADPSALAASIIATCDEALAAHDTARAQPAKAPDGYAYRYYCYPWQTGTVIRFNNGEEINGSKPIEAIPFYYGQQSAQPASAAEGWVMVPREPTEAMARAYDIYGIWVSRGYKAMLAAAPQPAKDGA